MKSVPSQAFVSFAPGRVCVFGEHQDYLGLPVIAAAIPLGCRMVVQPNQTGIWSVTTPALGFDWSCTILEASKTSSGQRPPGPNEFLLSGLQEALDLGWDVQCGGDVICHVDLPVQAGLSSSSALVVAWVHALARVADVALTPMELAQVAYRVEVERFGAPGGHMDHVASAIGGVLRIHPNWKTEGLESTGDGAWVVVDSGEPKDTFGHLERCKSRRQALVAEHGGEWVPPESLESWSDLTPDDRALWQATWKNKHLEEYAHAHWGDSEAIAEKMSLHHEALRDGLGLSTPALEALGLAAMKAGAWGWKVVGSGGGGCGLVWCPRERVEAVHQAVRSEGARASWTVRSSDGAQCTLWQRPSCPTVVLAAGRSTRMKHLESAEDHGLSALDQRLVQERPKAMLPVNSEGKPFLALLLEQLREEGVDDVCVVISSQDDQTPEWIAPWVPPGMTVGFARQTMPAGATKPLGTADAVECALLARPEWRGQSVSVFNGDNLPPEGAARALQSTDFGTVAFAQSALGLPPQRAQAFAAFRGSPEEGVTALIEKPTTNDVEELRDGDGELWVSMNLFRLPYEAMLQGCQKAPIHPIRGERELPTAVMLAAEQTRAKLQWIPFRGAFLDLTHPSDWTSLKNDHSL